ncbi:hypothetical protein INT47_004461, partial [Mucor saturninus]
TTVAAQNSCISLANSKTCTAFSQFYIGLPGLGTEYPFLLNTTTIEEFDKRLLSFVNSTSSYLFPLGCLSSNYNPTIPYARYSITKLCAAMIQSPSHSLPCNFDYDLVPPPLCQKTCIEWVDSIDHITHNPRVCSDSIQRNDSLANFLDQCHTWEGFNGTVSDNCISGIANEPYTCGFGPDNAKYACRYCEKNPDDGCCQNVANCSQKLSTGAIVGIAIGSAVGVAAIGFCIFLSCRKRKDTLFRFMSASATSSSTTQAKALMKEPLELQPTANNSKLQITSDFSTTIIPPKEEFYVVIHPYPSQLPDELELKTGDIICLAMHFDDGWALGFNVTTGLKGAFPLVCISHVPADSLDQLLNPEEVPLNASPPAPAPAPSPLPLPLPSTQHNNTNNKPIINTTPIPKRSASCKSNYDYIEAESPSSPTFHTPFFNQK